MAHTRLDEVPSERTVRNTARFYYKDASDMCLQYHKLHPDLPDSTAVVGIICCERHFYLYPTGEGRVVGTEPPKHMYWWFGQCLECKVLHWAYRSRIGDSVWAEYAESLTT